MTDRPNDDCIFCKIIGRQVPAAVIHEDERVIVFADAFPSSEGHSLVVPKAHRRDIFEVEPQDLQQVALVAQRLAKAQKKALQPDGVVITQFNGAAAGQTVFHYHMHVVPRWQGQALNIHGREQAAPETLEAVADKLGGAFG